MPEQSFILCSYYTLDNEYANVAHKYIMPSVLNLKIKSDIRGVPSLGNWNKNTNFKPQFISIMLEHHTENVVFVDCDAEVLCYPELFDKIPDEYNFACHMLDRSAWYNQPPQEKELLSGTLWIKNTKESRAIVKEWELTCKVAPVWEQTVLDIVLKKHNNKPYELPIEYCWIRDLPDGREPLVKPNGPIVVRHNQLSRKLRNVIR